MKYLFLFLVFIFCSVLLAEAAKRRVVGRRQAKQKIVGSKVKSKNATHTSNTTQSTKVTKDPRTVQIMKLTKKGKVLAKKLEGCQKKAKDKEICEKSLKTEEKGREKLELEILVLQRKLTASEKSEKELKKNLAREQATSKIIMEAKMNSLKMEYDGKTEELRTLVKGLNYSLIFCQANLKVDRQRASSDANVRLNNVKAKYASRMSNLQATLKSLNKTLIQISSHDGNCAELIKKPDLTRKQTRTTPRVTERTRTRPKGPRTSRPDATRSTTSTTRSTTSTTRSTTKSTTKATPNDGDNGFDTTIDDVTTASDIGTTIMDETTLGQLETTLWDITTGSDITTADLTTNMMPTTLADIITTSSDEIDEPLERGNETATSYNMTRVSATGEGNETILETEVILKSPPQKRSICDYNIVDCDVACNNARGGCDEHNVIVNDDTKVNVITNITAGGRSFSACCQCSAEGDWLVVKRDILGSEYFNRTWKEYVDGFGDLNEQFWIGLDILHEITADREYELRFDRISHYGVIESSYYSAFSVGDSRSNYALSIPKQEEFSNLRESSDLFGDGIQFSTFDLDHDLQPDRNCAKESGIGWWHGTCDGKGRASTYDFFEGLRTILFRIFPQSSEIMIRLRK